MEKLYVHTEEYHNLNSPREIVPLIISKTNPKSILDVGCGIGTWLKAFEEKGVSDFVGVDGSYVDKSLLQISADKFISQDLRKSWDLQRKFDLVISLEVAEHLPESCAESFVASLVRHGDVILFSAAIPGQGGQNHVNEQSPKYWQEKFAKHGFYFHDDIRPLIWESEKIELWYKQNLFVVKRERPEAPGILFTVHPDLFYLKQEYHRKLIDGEFGIKLSLSILFKAIGKKVRSWFSSSAGK